jgi:hypothetical protein
MNEKLRELVQARPFRPFELRLTNGESHLVRRPEHVMLLNKGFVLIRPKTESAMLWGFSEVAELRSAARKAKQ